MLWGVKCDTFVLEEPLGEVVCIHNTEHATIDLQINANVEVLPSVELRLLPWDEHLVSLQEHSLRNATVFYLGLKHVQSIVIEIVVNNALAYAIVFIGVFNDWLLEICIEVQHLQNRR